MKHGSAQVTVRQALMPDFWHEPQHAPRPVPIAERKLCSLVAVDAPGSLRDGDSTCRPLLEFEP